MTSDRSKRLEALGPGAPNAYNYAYFRELNNASEAKALESLLLGIFDKYRIETIEKIGFNNTHKYRMETRDRLGFNNTC
jgi:hypothetical protein